MPRGGPQGQQLESPVCSQGQEQQQLSTSECVKFGGCLPEQHFPAVRYVEAVGFRRGLDIVSAAAFPAG